MYTIGSYAFVDRESLSFEKYTPTEHAISFYISQGSASDYDREEARLFATHGLKRLPIEDRFDGKSLRYRGAFDVYGAISIAINKSSFYARHDHFKRLSEKVIACRQEALESADEKQVLKMRDFDNFFLKASQKKHIDLLADYERLRAIGKKLNHEVSAEPEYKGESINDLARRNIELIDKIDRLSKSLVPIARAKRTQYNDDALKAGILEQAYVANAEALKDVKNTYMAESSAVTSEEKAPTDVVVAVAVDTEQKSERVTTVATPVEMRAIPKPIVPRAPFPTDSKLYVYVDPDKEFCSTNFFNEPSLFKWNLDQFEARVNNLCNDAEKVQVKVSGWTAFWRWVAASFVDLFHYISKFLSDEKNTAGQSDVTKVIAGEQPDPETAIRFKFKNAVSPLKEIIWDKEITPEQKLKYLKEFTNAKTINAIGGKKDGYGFKDYDTPLLAALTADKVEIEIVKFLLEKGADVNIKSSSFSNTPLHYACENIELMRLLLKYGAEVNGKGYCKQTPLYTVIHQAHFMHLQGGAAVKAKLNSVLEKLDLLAEHKADFNAEALEYTGFNNPTTPLFEVSDIYCRLSCSEAAQEARKARSILARHLLKHGASVERTQTHIPDYIIEMHLSHGFGRDELLRELGIKSRKDLSSLTPATGMINDEKASSERSGTSDFRSPSAGTPARLAAMGVGMMTPDVTPTTALVAATLPSPPIVVVPPSGTITI